MKFFTACLATETNTFSPMPTGLKSFHVARGGDYSTYPPYKDSVQALFRKLAAERGWSVEESLIASAEPAGRTLRAVYEGFRDEIIADLTRVLPVDAVLLDLHGAMIAEGYDDCEGDLIAAVRNRSPDADSVELTCTATTAEGDTATAIVITRNTGYRLRRTRRRAFQHHCDAQSKID
jgi:microcystin degradation protein MlrC